MRERWTWQVGILGALVLVGYGVVPTFQLANFGRVYAIYGEVLVVLTVLWDWWINGQRPDPWRAYASGSRAWPS